jgi:hypothetical protein
MFCKCPYCRDNIIEIAKVLLNNLKYPLGKECVFCLMEMYSIENNIDQLVSCPKCGNIFHSVCWYNYFNYSYNNYFNINQENINNPVRLTSNIYPIQLQPVNRIRLTSVNPIRLRLTPNNPIRLTSTSIPLTTNSPIRIANNHPVNNDSVVYARQVNNNSIINSINTPRLNQFIPTIHVNNDSTTTSNFLNNSITQINNDTNVNSINTPRLNQSIPPIQLNNIYYNTPYITPRDINPVRIHYITSPARLI